MVSGEKCWGSCRARAIVGVWPKNPNDRDQPVPDPGDLGKSVTLETGGSSAEGSGGVTAVGEIVKGSVGQIGSDLVVSGRVRPTEDSRRLDLSVHQLEMPVF